MFGLQGHAIVFVNGKDNNVFNIDTLLAKEQLQAGFIKVDENQKTNVENLFACGDITSKQFKQVVTACADGARAGNSCIGE